MTATAYADFLARKERQEAAYGVDVAPSAVHPLLHEWQARTVCWAVKKGRCAIWWDTGLGKTFAQLEWARLIADRCLIVAPLAVAQQTAREAGKLGLTPAYVRSQEQVTGPGLWVTNYEMVDHFDPAVWPAVVFDESSRVKHHDTKTRQKLCRDWGEVPYRLACTATPAPNDVAELCNHAELLGIMPRVEMLAAYFVHDDEGWRLKGHAVEPMWRWISSWATCARLPSDLGDHDDEGYVLPGLTIHQETVPVDIEAEGQLFATDLGGVGGRAAIRRQTLDARVARAIELAKSTDDQWIVWCGLNDESQRIASAIPGAVEITGSMTPDEKASRMVEWLDGQHRVLVTKPSLAGFGINAQQCHRMVFVGLGDSYESYYQAIRRCYRYGQSEPVDVHIVVSELEAQIVDNVRRKEKQDRSRVAHLARFSREELARV